MFGAVDIGGTKTLVAVFNKDGQIEKKIRFLTPPSYSDFKALLADNVVKLSTTKCLLATVAAPGKIDRSRGVGIAFGNLKWLSVPLRDDIEKMFKCPVLVENDAKLAGLSEAIALQKEKYRKVLYVTISTGINSGLIINGVIDSDFEDSEVGQMLLDHDGKLERWEDFASGKAITATFGKPAKDITDPKAWHSIAHNIALGLIDLIANLTPDAIVIGGGVGAHFEKFKDLLLDDLAIYQNNLLAIPPIMKAVRAEEAVIYGCYDFSKYNYEHAHKNN